MKRIINLIIAVIMLTSLFYSCQKEEVNSADFISPKVIEKISHMGFNPDGIIKLDEGYLIEGDIVIKDADLNGVSIEQRVPQLEQYHTFNLVEGTPRVINLYMGKKLGSAYLAGLQEAADRYNAQNLAISFAIVSSKKKADIVFNTAPRFAGYLASAGFPTADGDPHNLIRVNTRLINTLGGGNDTDYLGSLLAHEIGHCIGFRHTDWFDRSISCGSGGNEGVGSIGAEYIPGTPAGADLEGNGSFMLSCIGTGTNRPFTSADETALDYLY